MISQIVVTAKADCGSVSPAPHMQVFVDGRMVGETDVTNSTYADSSPFVLTPPRHANEVAIAFSNDNSAGGCDHNLYVEKVVLTTPGGAVTINALTPAHVLYDRGDYFDSIDVLPATTDLGFSGALRFTLGWAPPLTTKLYASAANFNDVRYTGATGTWVDVAGRVVTYSKQSPQSILLVTYQDTFGFAMTGSHATSCLWRLLMDGGPAGRAQWNHSSTATGWRIWSGSMKWLLSGVAAGSHTFRIQVLREVGASECLNGWGGGSQENFLLVEEK